MKRLYHYICDFEVDGPTVYMAGDCSKIWGRCNYVTGEVSGLQGDVTGVMGNVSGVSGIATGICCDLGDTAHFFGDITYWSLYNTPIAEVL
mgnify:FL=1|tara:strand:- start:1187 stop:1459 length:273 start_codon:yes stop_codon:yes gene_type:complete